MDIRQREYNPSYSASVSLYYSKEAIHKISYRQVYLKVNSGPEVVLFTISASDQTLIGNASLLFLIEPARGARWHLCRYFLLAHLLSKPSSLYLSTEPLWVYSFRYITRELRTQS